MQMLNMIANSNICIAVVMALFVLGSSALPRLNYFAAIHCNLSIFENQFKKILKIKTPIECALLCSKTGTCNTFHFDKSSDVCSVGNIPSSKVQTLLPSDGNGTLLWLMDLPQKEKKLNHNYKSAKRLSEIELNLGDEAGSSLSEITILYVNGSAVVFGADYVHKNLKLFYRCRESDNYCHNNLSLEGTIELMGRTARLSDTEVIVSDTKVPKFFVVKMNRNKSLYVSRTLKGDRAYKDLECFEEDRLAGVYREETTKRIHIDVINTNDGTVLNIIIFKDTPPSQKRNIALSLQPLPLGFAVSYLGSVLGFSYNGDKLWDCEKDIENAKDVTLDYDGNLLVVLFMSSKIAIIEDECKSVKTVITETDGIKYPLHMISDKDGFIYVTEMYGTTLSIYGFK